ncbi:MAG: serine/threonine protein kinase, partial [Myxococcota bacterium]|nr:serine/threonine protein kinase [Myxococcota bacterium]
MLTPATSCPSDNTLAACLAGDLGDGELGVIHEHIDGCVSCRGLVADLGRDAHEATGLPVSGDLLGRYVIRRVLGVGGMGVVYEAHDPSLDRRVALKLLRPDIVDRTAAHDATHGGPGAHLLAEAQAMARLRHPNIAVAHDIGIARGQLFLCMEYVDGVTLRAWLDGARAWRTIVDAFLAAGRGLAYVHAQGLVHLDFKPDNVLVAHDGSIVVTDFGVAAMARAIGKTTVVGTPRYMAPEQRRGGALDARADQYAFCITLREALEGHQRPARIDRAIARGLAECPADRFATMTALLAAVDPPAPTPPAPIANQGRGRARLRAVATVCATTLATALVVVEVRGDAPRAPAVSRSHAVGMTPSHTPAMIAPGSLEPGAPAARQARQGGASAQMLHVDSPIASSTVQVPASIAATPASNRMPAHRHALAAAWVSFADDGAPTVAHGDATTLSGEAGAGPQSPLGLVEVRRCDDAFGLACPLD